MRAIDRGSGKPTSNDSVYPIARREFNLGDKGDVLSPSVISRSRISISRRVSRRVTRIEREGSSEDGRPSMSPPSKRSPFRNVATPRPLYRNHHLGNWEREIPFVPKGGFLRAWNETGKTETDRSVARHSADASPSRSSRSSRRVALRRVASNVVDWTPVYGVNQNINDLESYRVT